MKRCYFCKGEIIDKKIEHIHCWGKTKVLFKNLPTEVCKQCGEVYFTPDILEGMDKAVEHLEDVKETIKIPVVSFRDSVFA